MVADETKISQMGAKELSIKEKGIPLGLIRTEGGCFRKAVHHRAERPWPWGESLWTPVQASTRNTGRAPTHPKPADLRRRTEQIPSHPRR